MILGRDYGVGHFRPLSITRQRHYTLCSIPAKATSLALQLLLSELHSLALEEEQNSSLLKRAAGGSLRSGAPATPLHLSSIFT